MFCTYKKLWRAIEIYMLNIHISGNNINVYINFSDMKNSYKKNVEKS